MTSTTSTSNITQTNSRSKKNKKSHPANKIIGWAMYTVAFVAPLTNLPQILLMFQTQVVSGLSLQSWILYAVFCIVPLAYGINNKITPLVITNALWILVDIIMIIGILRFGTFSNSSYEQMLLINNIGKTLAGLGFIMLSSAAALFANDLLYVKKSKYV